MKCNEAIYRSDEGDGAGDGAGDDRTKDGGSKCKGNICKEECRLQQIQFAMRRAGQARARK